MLGLGQHDPERTWRGRSAPSRSLDPDPEVVCTEIFLCAEKHHRNEEVEGRSRPPGLWNEHSTEALLGAVADRSLEMWLWKAPTRSTMPLSWFILPDRSASKVGILRNTRNPWKNYPALSQHLSNPRHLGQSIFDSVTCSHETVLIRKQLTSCSSYANWKR